MTSRRQVVVAAYLIRPTFWYGSLGAAEPYLSKLFTILVPQAAGGTNDVHHGVCDL